MTYTILSATWGNDEHTSAVVISKEVAAVVISLVDTPEEWAAFLEWAKTNPVSDLPIQTKPQPMTKQQIVEKRLGMTITELKALLNG